MWSNSRSASMRAFQERWKVTAEQAKAESTQRGLEEERRILSMQISMEREELERAKVEAVRSTAELFTGRMCLHLHPHLSVSAVERVTGGAENSDAALCRRAEEAGCRVGALSPAGEAAARQGRAGGEQSAGAEGGIHHQSGTGKLKDGGHLQAWTQVSLVKPTYVLQEQADMKLRTAELKRKEAAVTEEREALDRLREDLNREREKISSTALRLKTRAQEVEAFSKVTSHGAGGHTELGVMRHLTCLFFIACRGQTRGGRASAAEGEARGGRARGATEEHSHPDGASEAAGAETAEGASASRVTLRSSFCFNKLTCAFIGTDETE